MPDSTDSASFGPMPLTAISRSNRSCSSARREPEQRDLILAHVRVDAQRHGAAGLAGLVERRQRHLHVVADAVDVDDQAARVLLEQVAAQDGDHRSAQRAL